MALYCLWVRRACSRFAALGVSAPPGSKVEAHLSACDSCRAYWRGLSLLATDLNSLIVVPQPSARYAEPVWDRLRPTSRVHRRGPLYLSAAAACGLACGWTVWFTSTRGQTGKSTPQWVAKAPGQPDEQAAVLPGRVGPVSTAPDRTGTVFIGGSDSAEPIVWKPSRHRRRRARSYATDRPESGPMLASRNEGAATWRTSGILYESEGDPGLANAAYQAAYSANPSEETAFDMGRSAEESGDMEQAMDVYARLLEGADGSGRSNDTQKGWTP